MKEQIQKIIKKTRNSKQISEPQLKVIEKERRISHTQIFNACKLISYIAPTNQKFPPSLYLLFGIDKKKTH